MDEKLVAGVANLFKVDASLSPRREPLPSSEVFRKGYHEVMLCADFPKRHVESCRDRDLKSYHQSLLSSGEFMRKNEDKGFIVAMIGPRGTGKTEFATRISASMAQRISVMYCKAMKFFVALKETYNREVKTTEGEILKRFTQPELLVVDELQERSESDWENRMLTHMIDTRYDRMINTILISNLSHDAFQKSIGDSIYDRIIETGMVVECIWPSYRTK